MILKLCCLLSLCYTCISYAQQNIIKLANETLKLNALANNYALKKEVAERFADIKEYIQTDLKNGNPKARVDIFLLLDGLIQNNISSLQSFLATSDSSVLSEQFAQNITYEYAEKLAYAAKENKNILSTEYLINSTADKEQCIYYVNGKKIHNNNSFFAPAGLSYYLGAYCPDNSFAVQKVQSETAQAKYKVNFAEFHTSSSVFAKADPNIKTPPIAQPKIEQIPAQNKDIKEQNIDDNFAAKKSTHLLIPSVGLSYSYFSGALKDDAIYNAYLGYGSLLYLNAKAQYKNIFASINFAPIMQDLKVKKVNSSTIITYVVEKKHAFFIQPEFGFHQELYSLKKNTVLSLDSSIDMAIISNEIDTTYQAGTLGIKLAPNFSSQGQGNLSYNYGFHIGLNFPHARPDFVLGTQISLQF